MNKLDIYCFTSKDYNFLSRLPKNIIPIGLGNYNYKNSYLKETSGINLSKHNKYYAELSGIYWVYKNKLSEYNDNDFIGFCHYRRLWLDKIYNHKHYDFSNLYSKILHNINDINEKNCETFLLEPTKLKNENIYDHFINNHGNDLIEKISDFLEPELYNSFIEYMKKREFSACNMFITKPKYFKQYCEFIFPFLEKILAHCFENNLCEGRNIKLPAYFIERFSSFWFHHHYNVKYLSYAELGSYFTSNLSNKFINTLKTPLGFLFYPTSLDI